MDNIQCTLILQKNENTFHKPALLLTGRRASKRNLEARAPRAEYLHIATHAFSVPDRSFLTLAGPDGTSTGRDPSFTPATGERAALAPSLLCGIYLAGANLKGEREGREGVLTAEELQALDLTSCRLAVLSGCGTAVGLVRTGEGIISLQRALYIAGVRGSVTTLWEVHDVAACELLRRFYGLLWREGLPPVAALRQAKLALMKEEKHGPGPGFRDPFYWASFVYWGEVE